VNIGSFVTSLQSAGKVFDALGLLKMRGVKLICYDGVSQAFKNAAQQADYYTVYKTAIENFDYDILLADDSLLQFSFAEDEEGSMPIIRYAFFQNPKHYTSYNSYLDLLRKDGVVVEESNEDIGDTFREEHEQYLIEAQVNSECTSIRYDTDLKNYRPRVHSFAHMHIGNYGEVRLPCDKIITPLKFSLFILRHVYYTDWKRAILDNDELLIASLEGTKSDCLHLTKQFWTAEEQQELFLS
jgi:hypothetical protein